MKQNFTPFLLVLFLMLISEAARAQCSTTPCVTPMPSVNAQDACILPNPAALDCYFGATTPDPPVSFPPYWCTAIHNNHWFAFTADATTATFEIACYGCAQGNGIQAAVLATTDCIDFTFVSPCLGNIPTGTSQTLTATGLTPGQNYYICIDGSGGALCDYSINGVNPTINGNTNGICIPSSPTSTFTANTPSIWSINPPGAGNILVSANNTQATVNWSSPGPAQVCAQSVNCPNAPNLCLDVNVGEDITEIQEYELCQGKSVECAGKTYKTGGTFPVTLTSYLGCDSTIKCVIKMIPTPTVTQNLNLCQGQSVSCAGQEFYTPGTFPITLTTDKGCDSIVKCVIKLIPTYVSPYHIINLCGPAEYVVCGNPYQSSGLYTQICTNYLGCDSIVNINLAILEPVAAIKPPLVLDCGANAIITLDGSGSSVNSAVGGVTLYKWSGPGIVGANNTPTIQVNKPGDYCLILTHGRGGLYCYDTTCVTVKQNAGVPQTPQLSGNPSPCSGSTIIYSATAAGNPPPTNYTWTTPGGQPYVPISADSIQITWPAPLTGGQICVTAQNACGNSPTTCVPVNVLEQALVPKLAGPDSVCIAGGAYLYTLDSLQPGTTYTWTLPAGAVLNGAGDSVSVNFVNAVSGAVCVSAKNSCGATAPVCKNVQVIPMPTASLAGVQEICAGESVQLTFSLSGNPPFDVTWSDGNQQFTLKDVPNGHQVTVTPAQSTTYNLVSVSDNSTPACAAAANSPVPVAVWPLASTAQTISICGGQTAFLAGAPQAVPGIYYDTLQTLHGCDSVIASTLIVHPLDTLVLALSSCDPALVGTTVQTFTQTNGCDSVVITTVALLPTDTVYLSDNSCDPANAGTFIQNLSNQYGCDSTVVTTVYYADSDTTYTTATTCDPASVGVFQQLLTALTDGCDSLVVTTVSLVTGDTTYVAQQNCDPAAVGTFIAVFNAQNGCDSTVITTVSLLPKDTTYLTGQDCNPANVGVFAQTLSNQFGCDSLVITTVAFSGIPPTLLTATSCNPAAVGVFSQTITTAAGCDSTIITTVTFNGIPPTQVAATTCDPTAAGVFTNVITTAAGCDSTVITTVALLPSDTTFLTGKDCNPTKVGVFASVLSNKYGCDSTIITTISFNGIPPTPVAATTCDPAAAGVFTNVITTAAGCDSTVITTVALLPSDTTFRTGQDCNPANVGVFTAILSNHYGCDSTIITTVTFNGILPTQVAATTCDPAAAGVFTQHITTSGGCDSTVITTVALLPSNQVAVQSTTCDPAAAGVFTYNLSNQYGCDSIVTETVKLLPRDTTYLTQTTCDENQTGTVVKVLTNHWGCDSTIITTTSLLPAASCGTLATLSGSTIPCGATTGTLTLTATLGIPPFAYTVLSGGTPVASGTVNAMGQAQTISGLAAGSYTVTVSSPNGFSTTAQATIVQLYPPVLTVKPASNYNGFNISCAGATDGSAQATVTGGALPFNFTWSTGGTSLAINNLAAGVYSVTVVDANGCSATGVTSLIEPAPLKVAFRVSDLDCFGQHDGAIFADPNGGAVPYKYALNNGAKQSVNAFNHLDPGSYTVTVWDANGCQVSEIIAINAPIPLDVELGDNQTIQLGDTAVLEAIVNVPFDSLASITWTPAFDSSECPKCLTQSVVPLVSTTYSIKIVANNGCRDEDKVVVYVDRRRHLYIPNIFSPNGDGENDIFSIFAKRNTVRKIKSMQIYNRWGEALYVLRDFAPNDPVLGWNGEFRGQPMSPGVFAWVLEVEFIDGVTEVYSGDVTLVR